MTLAYDPNTDTLHIAFEAPTAGEQFYNVESVYGDIYRIDEVRRVIVGCTIVQFKKRINRDDGVSLPEIGPVGYDPNQMTLFEPQDA